MTAKFGPTISGSAFLPSRAAPAAPPAIAEKARQSGGSVEVESEVRAGTTFTLILPRSAKPVPTVAAQNGVQTAARVDRGCILIVEDNPEVGAFTSQLFDELGYDAVLAANGEQALTLLDQSPAHFKLVFSDVMMPGISGIALGQEVRKRYPDIPFLLTSGYSQVLASDGPLGFELLQKPYTVESLFLALQRAAQQRASLAMSCYIGRETP